jgi:hypothetical protein
VVLTIDYEMYFGRSGTVDRCMLSPTDTLLRELDAIGARACFFVDATFLHRLAEDASTTEDAERVCEQIAAIVDAGHRVELHVHPQWLDASPGPDGEWEFSRARSFALGELETDVVVEMMRSAAGALTKAAQRAVSDYELQAFRAAGLCAQPFDAIAVGMQDLGLVIDSSIAPGLVVDSSLHSYDYRGAPTDVCWRFDSDPLVPSPEGRFIELPLSPAVMGPATRILGRIDRSRRPAAYRVPGDGQHRPVQRTARSKWLPTPSLYTLDSTAPVVLRRLWSRAPDTVTFISHSKTVSPASIESLGFLVSQDVRFALPHEIIEEQCMAGSC